MKTFSMRLLAGVIVLLCVRPVAAQYAPAPYPIYAPYMNPYAGNLYGAASVINAQSQQMLATQQAYMDKEKILQEKNVTRRKAIDEYLYEQRVLPGPEQKREMQRQQQLQRSRNDPPLTEIWSAKALNDILLDLQRHMVMPGYSPTMPLDPEIVKHLNFTDGRTSGSVSILTKLDTQEWPMTLTSGQYASYRKKITEAARQAVEEGKKGKVDPMTIRELSTNVEGMTGLLRASIAGVPSNQYVSAKRFCDELKSAVTVLQQPNVARYFTDFTPQASTVPELVGFMTGKGLRFAPASSGDETYYTALHRSLANYDIAISNQSASAGFQQSPGNRR
ncbi:MAG: hypothetical protein AB7K24_29965 [Gemmataceae bacterium]